ncbi:MAG: hypothetical protein EA423_03915 [Phycisphaerales bacterium]|nr:MAG: hypothetical protein EA423_03915 [Phycisphaerales bacterium]
MSGARTHELRAGRLRATLLAPGPIGHSLPLVLFLHGIGECGTDASMVQSRSLPSIARADPSLWPAPMLIPQKPDPQRQWEDHAEEIIQLLDRSLEHGVAGACVITGNSQGGHGALVIAARHPDRFERVLSVCPYADPPENGYGASDWPFDARSALVAEIASGLRSTPVRITHGLDDEIVPPDHARGLLVAISAGGGDCRLELMPETDHDAWSETYSRADYAAWLLGIG